VRRSGNVLWVARSKRGKKDELREGALAILSRMEKRRMKETEVRRRMAKITRFLRRGILRDAIFGKKLRWWQLKSNELKAGR